MSLNRPRASAGIASWAASRRLVIKRGPESWRATPRVLAIIVIIRTFLSMALQVEIEGRWPWQPRRLPHASQVAERK